MRDPGAWAVMPGAPDCPVLRIPESFWDSLSLGSLIERGSVSAADIDADVWTDAEIAWGALTAARAAQAEVERKKAEMVRNATKRV